MNRPSDVRPEGVSNAGPTGGAPRRLRFRDFELDAEAGELRRDGQPVRLQQQPCKVLALLAGRAGELVTRDEIRRSVWGADTYVNFDQGLNFCIKEIRAALGDQADTPTFIETLPRRGYRFIAEVEETAGTPAAAPPLDEAPPVRPGPLQRRRVSRPLLIASAAALALAAAAGITRVGRDADERGGAFRGRQMLAVLPFENLTADPAQDYLGDGLTEEMIAQIGRLQPDRLGVIARTSAMQYRSRNKDVWQIGDELGVDYIVEGSVRRGEDRIRITVKLIQVSDQTQLWAEAYDRSLDDLLSVQREVAEAVARSIQLTLSDGAQARLQRDHDVAPRAYELYLRGRHSWNRRDREGLQRAVRFFEQSIEADPDFALAWVGLADAWIVLGDRYVPPDVARTRIREAVERAIELDPELPEAQTSMAMLEATFDWNWEAGVRRFQAALEGDPNSATTRQWYSQVLSAVGRPEAALAEAELALELDPLSLIVNTTAASALYGSGRPADAATRFERILALDPEWTPALWGLGRSLVRLGEIEKGLALLERAAESERFRPLALAHLAHGYAAAGEPASAARVLAALEAEGEAEDGWVSPYELAIAMTAAGEKERAFETLERAVELGVPRLRFLPGDDRLAALHGDPRFERLLEQMGLGG